MQRNSKHVVVRGTGPRRETSRLKTASRKTREPFCAPRWGVLRYTVADSPPPFTSRGQSSSSNAAGGLADGRKALRGIQSAEIKKENGHRGVDGNNHERRRGGKKKLLKEYLRCGSSGSLRMDSMERIPKQLGSIEHIARSSDQLHIESRA